MSGMRCLPGALLGTVLALAGCKPPTLHDGWGYAQRTNSAEMVENPDAEHENLSAVRGLDPNTSDQVVRDRYRTKQSKETESDRSVINVKIGN